jgi:hypothetical protein
MTPLESLRRRAETLHLHGLLAHWPELADSTWVEPLLAWEEAERARRSLDGSSSSQQARLCCKYSVLLR